MLPDMAHQKLRRTFLALALVSSVAACDTQRSPQAVSPTSATSSAGATAQLPADAVKRPSPKSTGRPRALLSVERVRGAPGPLGASERSLRWFASGVSHDQRSLELVLITCHVDNHRAELIEGASFVYLRIVGPLENDPGFCGGFVATVPLDAPLGRRALYSPPEG